MSESTVPEAPPGHTSKCKAIGVALTIAGEQVHAALLATALRSALVAASMRLTAARTIAHHECIVRMEREDHPSPVPREVREFLATVRGIPLGTEFDAIDVDAAVAGSAR